MRSIRRSMTLYLIAWALITVALVWVVMDRVTVRVLAAREADGRKLIETQYEQRCREEKQGTDEALLTKAKLLYGVITDHNRTWAWFKLSDQSFATLHDLNVPEPVLKKLEQLKDSEFSRLDLSKEIVNHLNADERKLYLEVILKHATYRLRVDPARLLHDLSQLLVLTRPIAEMIRPSTGSGSGNPIQSTVQTELAAFIPLPVETLQRISENNGGTDYVQVNVGATPYRGGEWHSKSLSERKLTFEPEEINAKLPDHDKQDAVVWVHENVTLAQDKEPVRRIVLRGTRLTPPRRLPSQGPPPGSGPPGAQRPGGPNPTRQSTPPPDNRLYIQCARPQTEIDARLAIFENERNGALGTLAEEINSDRKIMLLQAAGVGLVAVLAIGIGGPVIVGIGLRPVGKLSDAVSRVSEKDFKLPHSGDNLVQELVPIHSRLVQTLGLLQRAFSREKEQVADISHELRTPIAGLMATIDIALRKTRSPEQYRTALEECRLISKQLSQLVERIMTLATLDAGNDQTSISRTDTVELAAGCAAIIRPLAATNGITLQFHPPEEMIELDTDPNKLREVLINLLHNAVEYNRPNGTIDLDLRQEKNNVIFEVRDTGIGMTAEIKDKIFERFFRADPSRHATGVHAGLGLAIVKEYITLLNGSIIVESEPGVGSVFRVVLPALPPFESSRELQTIGASS